MYIERWSGPGRLVAQHMALRVVLITGRTADSVHRTREGPVGESLMIPHHDGMHPGTPLRPPSQSPDQAAQSPGQRGIHCRLRLKPTVRDGAL